ncbi:MAG TPA: hypothetical protein PLF88_12115, partial [Opitutaceae bacterium]|nr:hypothetical protein [Opitutaceae bacterium]
WLLPSLGLECASFGVQGVKDRDRNSYVSGFCFRFTFWLFTLGRGLFYWLPDTAAGSQPGPGQPPAALVTRHLVEADRCHREGEISLARSHCRAARQAIEQYQRLLRPATSTPATP